MAVALLIGAGAVWYATSLLAVQDPPSTITQPVIQLVLSPGESLQYLHGFPWASSTEYKVFETFQGCHNPVAVQVDALVNGRDIGGSTTAPGFADGALLDPSNAVSKVQVLFNHGTILIPRWVVTRPERMHRSVDRGYLGLYFRVAVQQWFPSAVLSDMRGAISFLASSLRFGSRQTGSCRAAMARASSGFLPCRYQQTIRWNRLACRFWPRSQALARSALPQRQGTSLTGRTVSRPRPTRRSRDGAVPALPTRAAPAASRSSARQVPVPACHSGC
jgi:hypothetical protein